MIKVWRSVGAVRVYSPFRALMVALVVIALLLVGGFFIGRAADDGASANVRTTQVTAPAPPPTTTQGDPAAVRQAYQRGRRAGVRAATRAATSGGSTYAQGFQAGTKAAFGRSGFAAGRAYFVMFKRGADGTLRAGPSIPARAGFLYRLCQNSQSVCERPGG